METRETYLEKANNCKQQEQWEKAIASYQTVLEIKPDDWEARHHLGDCLLNMERWQDAATSYRQALELNPNFIWSFHNLGVALVNLAQFEEAHDCFEKVRVIKEDFWELHQLDFSVQQKLGDYLFEQQRWQDAVTAYRLVISLNPDFVWVNSNLARALQRLGRSEEIVELNSNLSEEKQIYGAKHPPHFPNPSSPKVRENLPSIQITVVTDRKFLDDLHSSLNKIIISATDSHHYLASLASIDGIKVYQFINNKSTARGTILPLGEKLGDDPVEIQWSPTFCLGFLVLSPQGKQELEPLVNWWQVRGKEENLPEFLEIKSPENTTGFKTEFWQLIASALMAQTQKVSQRLSTLHRQYLSLRTLHENVQNAFAAVEDFLSQAKLPDLQLKFENQATKNSVIPTPGCDFVLKQLLPIGSRGLAAVDLHISKNNPHSRGVMVVAVEIPEDKTCLAKWQIPYQNLKAGWFYLDLPSIDIGFQREIELSVEFQTKLGPAPCLSLGMVQPVPEYQVYTQQESWSRSLAFRLWTGLPGTRRVMSPYSVATVADEASPLELIKSGYLGQRALLSLQEITPNLPTEDFPYIKIIGEGTKILLHPRKDKLTVAMLPYCFPPGASHLTATVATEHPEADIIEYAMAVIQEGMESKACFEGENPESAVAFSGWTAVKPGSTYQLQLSVEPSATEHYHIVMATRLPSSSHNHFAWAHWLNFHISF